MKCATNRSRPLLDGRLMAQFELHLSLTGPIGSPRHEEVATNGAIPPHTFAASLAGAIAIHLGPQIRQAVQVPHSMRRVSGLLLTTRKRLLSRIHKTRVHARCRSGTVTFTPIRHVLPSVAMRNSEARFPQISYRAPVCSDFLHALARSYFWFSDTNTCPIQIGRRIRRRTSAGFAPHSASDRESETDVQLRRPSPPSRIGVQPSLYGDTQLAH